MSVGKICVNLCNQWLIYQSTETIPCCTVLTDASGKFSLAIPFEQQRKKQRLELFKEGFHPKSITEPVQFSQLACPIDSS